MTGKSDETEADWLEGLFGALKRVTELTVEALVKAGPPKDVAEAEKLARSVGVIARTAKAVVALKSSAESLRRVAQVPDHEEEMSDQDRDLSDAELAGLKSEFFSRLDRLVAGLEGKSHAEGLDRQPAARGTDKGAAMGAEADAKPECQAGLAA